MACWTVHQKWRCEHLYDMIIAMVNVNDNNKSNDNYDDDGSRWEVT